VCLDVPAPFLCNAFRSKKQAVPFLSQHLPLALTPPSIKAASTAPLQPFPLLLMLLLMLLLKRPIITKEGVRAHYQKQPQPLTFLSKLAQAHTLH